MRERALCYVMLTFRICKVLENLKIIISGATKIVVMQYGLKSSDVNYFMSFEGADLYDSTTTYKIKVLSHLNLQIV